jgi:plastocyanin
MTESQRQRRIWSVVLAGSILASAGVAVAEQHAHPPAEQHAEQKIEMISTNVQGKNVFLPGTIVMTAGEPQTISLFNTTDTPHGFTIAAAGVQTVLPPKEEHEVKVPAMAAGLYWIDCQLHPPHRNAQLLVVDAPK